MLQSYEYFRYDKDPRIHTEWDKFVEKIDQKVEDALRLSVKRSLSTLYRAIMGDKTTEVQPLFLVYVVLDRQSVEFQPRLEELIEIVSRISGVESCFSLSSFSFFLPNLYLFLILCCVIS